MLPAAPPDPGAADWSAATAALDVDGFAMLPGQLDPAACAALADLWDDPARFRTRIDMARHGFGQGAYQYFALPLPEPVGGLRERAYAALVPLANRWQAALGRDATFPAGHAAYRAQCHAAGQTRPTPLLLRYGPGDHNCLHQDVYGPLLFPLQLAVLLSRPGVDFTGGEFVLVEQRPRRQSRAHVVPLRQGDGVVFAVRERPVRGGRGAYRVALRHGVSTIHSGLRSTLGVIFHDAA